MARLTQEIYDRLVLFVADQWVDNDVEPTDDDLDLADDLLSINVFQSRELFRTRQPSREKPSL